MLNAVADSPAAARDPRVAHPQDEKLDGLRPLAVGDLERYRAAVEGGGQSGWGYYFPYLLTRNRPGRSAMLWEEDEGSLVVYLWRRGRGRPRLDVYLAPMPMSPRVLTRALDRANDFNGDDSARVMRVDAADADRIAGCGRLEVRRRRRQYVYAPGTYGTLRGKNFYTIRRNIARVGALPDVEVVPYIDGHAEGCRELLARWRREHRRRHGTAGGAGTSRRAIELAGSLPSKTLHGEVILVDGRVAAFAFGGEIRPGVSCILDTKCDNAIPGLAYFQRYRFIIKLGMHSRVNDGSGTGREGLEQFKNSFRPVEMHNEFRATQRSA